MITKKEMPLPLFTKENNHLFETDVLIKYANEKYGSCFDEFKEVGCIKKKYLRGSQELQDGAFLAYIVYDAKTADGKILYGVNITENEYLKLEKSNSRYLKLKEILSDF
jgi:hypothetical protein